VTDVLICLFLLGWYKGDKIIDGEGGWFPSSSTRTITSDKVKKFNQMLVDKHVRTILGSDEELVSIEESNA